MLELVVSVTSPINIRKKGFQMLVKCLTCGKEYKIKLAAFKRAKRHFCSVPCKKLGRKGFWEHVVKTQSCWIWTGYTRGRGYGFWSVDGKTQVRAHRHSWEIHFGAIPPGYEVCHHCDNPACVRPDHLFVGTHLDNMRDAVSKGRLKVGEHAGRARLTWKQVEAIRKEYVPWENSIKNLSDKFGVSKSAIQSILQFKNWKSDLHSKSK